MNRKGKTISAENGGGRSQLWMSYKYVSQSGGSSKADKHNYHMAQLYHNWLYS